MKAQFDKSLRILVSATFLLFSAGTPAVWSNVLIEEEEQNDGAFGKFQDPDMGVMQDAGAGFINNEEEPVVTVDPDGTVHTVDPDGTVHRVDPDGTVHRTDPDGTVNRIDPDDTVHRVDLDGTVHRVDPDGTVHRTDPDGTIHRTDPDGTVHRVDPDGTVVTAELDDTVIVEEPDGTIIITDPDGTTTTSFPDGAIEVVDLDGTITTTEADGTTVVTHPDGTTEIFEADPAEEAGEVGGADLIPEVEMLIGLDLLDYLKLAKDNGGFDIDGNFVDVNLEIELATMDGRLIREEAIDWFLSDPAGHRDLYIDVVIVGTAALPGNEDAPAITSAQANQIADATEYAAFVLGMTLDEIAGIYAIATSVEELILLLTLDAPDDEAREFDLVALANDADMRSQMAVDISDQIQDQIAEILALLNEAIILTGNPPSATHNAITGSAGDRTSTNNNVHTYDSYVDNHYPLALDETRSLADREFHAERAAENADNAENALNIQKGHALNIVNAWYGESFLVENTSAQDPADQARLDEIVSQIGTLITDLEGLIFG